MSHHPRCLICLWHTPGAREASSMQAGPQLRQPQHHGQQHGEHRPHSSTTGHTATSQPPTAASLPHLALAGAGAAAGLLQRGAPCNCAQLPCILLILLLLVLQKKYNMKGKEQSRTQAFAPLLWCEPYPSLPPHNVGDSCG